MKRKSMLIGLSIASISAVLGAAIPTALLLSQNCTPITVALPLKTKYNESIDLILNNYKDKFKWAYAGDNAREEQYVPKLWSNLRDDINRAIEETKKNKV